MSKDSEHLQWVHDRFIHVYGENENVDFLIKMREIIASMKPEETNHKKVGDITSTGWEITKVIVLNTYQMRKRVLVTDCYRSELNGKYGYYYLEGGYKWVEIDDGMKIKLRDDEYEFVDELKKDEL